MTGARRAALACLALLALAVAAPDALAANYSHPATYSGPAATGGTVEFDVSADGAGVTRFVILAVPTSCGTIPSSTTTGTIPIANDSFSYGSATTLGIRFSGSFPAAQQAQGTLSVKLPFPLSCTSEDVGWSATTPTPPPDTTPPQTSIGSGPKGKTGSRKARFRFRSSEAGSTFQCKLDRKPWGSCRSPKRYRKLKPGRHTFQVRARDGAGNVDPTPAKRRWRVVS